MANRTLTDTATVTWDEATAAQVKGNVPDNAVTNAKLADMAQATIKGRAAGAGTGDPADLTATQVAAILGALGIGIGSGYIDFAEIAAPASPAADVARLYARDVSARTEIAYKNSSGQITDLLRGLISPKDYGAVGDGTTDDTAAITVVDALVPAKYVPSGVYDTTLAASALDGPYWGQGQIRDVANSLRAPWFSAIKAAPASLGDHSSITTAFNGDLSRVQIAMEHRITGAATLGQPVTGYQADPETSAVYLNMFNSSGHNQSLGSNVGRTAARAIRLQIANAGQGDCIGIHFGGVVSSTKASSTNFLANPAVTMMDGALFSGIAGAFLNAGEMQLRDGGFDSAGVGWNMVFERTVATGAKSAIWIGERMSSIGSQPIDVAYSMSGLIKNGLDTTACTISGAAIAIAANQRIYGNAAASASGSTDAGWYATALGTAYLTYSSALSAWSVVTGGVDALRVYADRVTSQVPVVVNHTTPIVFNSSITPRIQLHGTDASSSSQGNARYSAGATGPSYILAKSRNASIGGHTIVQASDTLGLLQFAGSDGTNFITGAYIEARCSGTPGTNDMPTSLLFFTTPDGSATPAERMVMDFLGNVVVGTAALATTATDGFLHIPTCAGPPTGVPTAYAGRAPMIIDTTNNRLYFYSTGVWRNAGP